MTARRSRGDGGLHWDDARQRWVATITVGHTPAGKRIVRKASGRTKTEARNRLKELVRDHDDGVLVAAQSYTVQQAVQDWLDHGLGGRDPSTVQTACATSPCGTLSQTWAAAGCAISPPRMSTVGWPTRRTS